MGRENGEATLRFEGAGGRGPPPFYPGQAFQFDGEDYDWVFELAQLPAGDEEGEMEDEASTSFGWSGWQARFAGLRLG